MSSNSSCWCGNQALEAFSADYLHCGACETLVAVSIPAPEKLLVRDDERDYYGKHYFDTTAELHGLPPLNVRARADLPERCLHWLRSLLRYCSPPARVLELGSAHGGYVAMMRWAGFDATGLDLSPHVVADARRRFGVPILEGPIESQNIDAESLDAIVLMDVLEHLGHPKETMRQCLNLLKADGVIFLQTPRYREGKSLEQMQKDEDPFLQMLMPDQHLYLFSNSSVKRLFGELGVTHIDFEPAIFSSYDMALVAGRIAPLARSEAEVVHCLESLPTGRLILALHDLDLQYKELTARYTDAEVDRAARLENSNKLEGLLTEQAATHFANSAAQEASIRDLTNRLKESEADRAVRLESTLTLEKLLAEQGSGYSANMASQQAAIEDLTNRLKESEADRAVRLENTLTLENLLAEQAASHSATLAARAAEISRLTVLCRHQQAQIAERDEQLQIQSGNLRELGFSLDRAHAAFNTKTEAVTANCNDLRKECIDFSKEIATQQQVIESQKVRLEAADNLLGRVRHTHVTRLLRAVHLWGWLDGEAEGRIGDAPSVPAKTGKALRKVVIDLTPVLPGGGNGGAKVMTVELIRQLCRIAPTTDFVLLTLERSHDELAALDAHNVSRLCMNGPDGPPVLAAGSSVVRKLGADLLFCPFTAPYYFDPGIPTVCVVYDLQHAYYPEFFDLAEIQERERNLARAIQSAAKIVCISEFVQRTLLEKTKATQGQVETIHILLPRRLGTPSHSQCESALQASHLVSGEFLLYPANFWPHKNHELLLSAFGIYLADHPESGLKLVLTGAPGSRRDFLEDAARRLGLSQRVLFPGYLPEEELSALLHSCLAVIFPSLFEGFGMPLLEAMAAERPLLCSNTTSLPEIAGDAALLFDPRKPGEMAEQIARIANDPSLRRDLAAKGAKRLNAFGGPEDMAARYLETFLQAAQQSVETPQGVYGVFGDGWLGERATIAFGSGGGGRRVQVALELPGWVSTPVVSIRVEDGGVVPRIHSLVPEGAAVVESAVGPDAGSIQLVCSPSFQPSQCGLGDDSRFLTCRLKQAEILDADGVLQVLPSFSHGA